MTISRRQFLKGLIASSVSLPILLTTPQNSPPLTLKNSYFKVISPSQEMERLGQQIVDGFSRGLSSQPTLSDRGWAQEGSDPIADLEAMNNKILKEIGLPPQYFTNQELLALAKQSLRYGQGFKEVTWKAT